ncbi:TonB-dependent siderophore receptor [Pelomonas sp. KK5]|uniref:TonB-dependent receptor plug domain-containing protein n=1 Tax=Pelomonas sp. KK5 TaxID=1855730 RepID=UPI0009F94B46|nr:TonB-dependent receptor [Pelomonas sp. KK5]
MRGACALLALGLLATLSPLARAAADLADLSLEELSNIEVSSVSRRSEKLGEVAASLYVISAEAIRRSGARRLPEALSLAPNLQVARVDANQYAITARGFNNAIGNKLLVLIDGRTVYAPYFSGVQWDMQDVLLDDVARIEVISGPGASVWGTNAVNGVINIVTKSAEETQGLLAQAGGGNLESLAALRYGGSLGDTGRFRVYAKLQRHQHTDSEAGAAVADGSHRAQLGARMDWLQGGEGLSIIGDAYHADTQDRAFGAVALGGIRTSGANILARWTGTLAGGSKLRLQGYYDRNKREDRFMYSPSEKVLDFEFQHSLVLGAHQIDWGGGLRQARDDIAPGLLFAFVPASSTQNWRNLFVQDNLRLSEQWSLIAGTKLEHNDYTGWETLPSLRLSWAPSAQQTWWTGWSRAVRAPARLDRDLRLPPKPPYIIAGGPDFVSEVANVFELGYRAQPSHDINLSATVYHYGWSRLRSGQKPPNAQVQNRIDGSTRGLEAWARWQPLQWLQLSAGLDLLHKDLAVQAGSTDPTGPSALGNDAGHQWQLRANVQLPRQQALEVAVRRVGALPNPVVPAYTALDLSWVWQVNRGLDLSLTGQNLLDPAHPENGTAPGRSEIARSVFLMLRWNP